jgi:hypothetical protein
MDDLIPAITGGGVVGAIAAVILGIIKAVDVYRKTGHTKETDILAQLTNQTVSAYDRNKELEARLDKLRERFDDAVDQNGRLRHLLYVNRIEIPPELGDTP